MRRGGRLLLETCCCLASCAVSATVVRTRPGIATAFAPTTRVRLVHALCTATMSQAFDAMAFGPKITIPSEHIFYQSTHSAAFVNLKPIVPGHVLVVPKRSVPRDNQLTEDEVPL